MRTDAKELHALGDQLNGTGTNMAGAFWQACEKIERAENPSADRRVLVGLVGRRATRLLFAILLRELTRTPAVFTSHVAALANGFVRETGEALQAFPFASRLNAFNGLAQQLAAGLQIGITEKVEAPPSSAVRDERIWWLLKIIESAGGSQTVTDYPHDTMSAFCEDREPTDTFNLAIERGLTRTTFDDRFETSTVHLTEAGSAYVAAHPLPGG